jgi:DNA-binding transcriptional ArsR family regulator/uncharacterized protein YndB with AHSA1/START domain
MSGGDVWSALANPLRRAVLDELRAGPRTTGELAAAHPELSRFAVMQHLGVLEEAGLLLVRREGRRRLNHLNPVPLEEIRRRWLSRFGEQAAGALLALKEHVEHEQEGRTGPDTGTEPRLKTAIPMARVVRIESELRVSAPRGRVFEALTAEQHRWYPYNYGNDRVRDLVFEPRVGGNVYEDWGDGAGHHYGVVTHYDPPAAFSMRGGLAGSTVLENNFELTESAGVTIVRHSMTAFGDLSDDDVAGIRMHGDMGKFEEQLRAWVEQGVAVR